MQCVWALEVESVLVASHAVVMTLVCMEMVYICICIYLVSLNSPVHVLFLVCSLATVRKRRTCCALPVWFVHLSHYTIL